MKRGEKRWAAGAQHVGYIKCIYNYDYTIIGGGNHSGGENIPSFSSYFYASSSEYIPSAINNILYFKGESTSKRTTFFFHKRGECNTLVVISS